MPNFSQSEVRTKALLDITSATCIETPRGGATRSGVVDPNGGVGGGYEERGWEGWYGQSCSIGPALRFCHCSAACRQKSISPAVWQAGSGGGAEREDRDLMIELD
jgi:hypothetical protein